MLLLALSAALAAAPPPAPAPPTPASASLEVARLAADTVVSLVVRQPRAFGDEPAGTAFATAFVVDAERGILATNRHVVGEGPVVAEGRFPGGETIPLRALYRDPVHDFGFFAYDPKALAHPPTRALALRPDHAGVGVDVWIAGNDAGDRFAILPGVVARTDVDAPPPEAGMDANTDYLLVSAGAVGGSSGSPAMDAHGDVVGLVSMRHVGSSGNYLLPVGPVAAALDAVRTGSVPARGDLGVVFRRRSLAELRARGLLPASEERLRAGRTADEALEVLDVDPAGPAAGVLRVGDVLAAVDGAAVRGFDELEAALDAHAAGRVAGVVERDGQAVPFEAAVTDLHAGEPRAWVEVGGAVLHAASPTLARARRLVRKGLYVSDPGFVLAEAGIGAGDVLLEVAGHPVDSVAALAEALAKVPDGDPMLLRYAAGGEARDVEVATARMDRRWYRAARCAWDGRDGRAVVCEDIAGPAAPAVSPPGRIRFGADGSLAAAALKRSLVAVTARVPWPVEGQPRGEYDGVGLVVDDQQGLVMVDRATVPVSLADVTVTVAGQASVPAVVRFVHPLHNVAVVQYDPSRLGKARPKAARLAWRALRDGQPLAYVGLSSTGRTFGYGARITGFFGVATPIPPIPTFRDANLLTLATSDAPGDGNGVLVDALGEVVAMWQTFRWNDGGHWRVDRAAVPASYLAHLVRSVASSDEPDIRTLGVEWSEIPMSEARLRGMPEAQAERLTRQGQRGARALVVSRRLDLPVTPALREGDLLLSVEGHPVNSLITLDLWSRRSPLLLTVVRDGAVKQVEAVTSRLASIDRGSVVAWAGMLVHPATLDAQLQRSVPVGSAYVSAVLPGSPAEAAGIEPGDRIVSVGTEAVAGMGELTAHAAAIAPDAVTTIGVVSIDGVTRRLTLRLDPVYFPGFRLMYTPSGWARLRL